MGVGVDDDSRAPPPTPVTCSQVGPQRGHAGLLTYSQDMAILVATKDKKGTP